MTPRPFTGLLMPWDGRIWLNPPYHRRTISAWLGRMAAHGRGTALIFARTDTAAFHAFVWQACTALLAGIRAKRRAG